MSQTIANKGGLHAVDVESNVIADGLMTVSEAAKFLSVGRTFLYAAMDSGALAFVKMGRARRIPRRALIQYASRALHSAS